MGGRINPDLFKDIEVLFAYFEQHGVLSLVYIWRIYGEQGM